MAGADREAVKNGRLIRPPSRYDVVSIVIDLAIQGIDVPVRLDVKRPTARLVRRAVTREAGEEADEIRDIIAIKVTAEDSLVRFSISFVGIGRPAPGVRAPPGPSG